MSVIYRCYYDGLDPAGCNWSTTRYSEIDGHEDQLDPGHLVSAVPPPRVTSLDLLQQMINEAVTVLEFQSAANMVRSHIETNRGPEINHALVVGLAMKGHSMIADSGTLGVTSALISRAVMSALNAEPR